MALLDSEVLRIKAELGYNQVGLGALPSIGHVAIFEQVIQPYLTAGASTTSVTAVTAASVPTPVTLTLASMTGVSPFALVVLDVDSRQEEATISSVDTMASTITVLLSGEHGDATGMAYPVTVDGGESNVRRILREISRVKAQFSSAASRGGLKRAEDVEWFQDRDGGSSLIGDLQKMLAFWRAELASALGVANMWEYKAMAATSVALY